MTALLMYDWRLTAMAKKNPPVLKSVAIHQLRTLAVELKKTPTVNDIVAAAKQRKCPSITTIRQLFGGMAEALKESRLPPQRLQEFTEDELIAQLRNLSSALGRPLTRRDVKKAGKAGTCARLVTFQRVFGSAGNAFRRAGVQRFQRFTREELIAQYIALHKDLGKLPTALDIDRAARAGRCAGNKVFVNTCGTLTQLREAAGFGKEPRRKYSRSQLLEQLKRLAATLGRPPLVKELITACREGTCADIQTFQRWFGTYNAALKAAGLRIRPTSFSREQLIQMLQALARELGHRPTVKEVNQAKLRGECASAPTYDNYFGNMSSALRAAGLDGMQKRVAPRKPRKPRKLHTRDQMVQQLRRLGEMLGRPPRQMDVAEASARRECAAVSTLAVEFGSFGAALRSVGFDVPLRTKEYTDAQLIEQLRQLTRELGRLPKTHDIDRSRACASTMTFVHRFGSLAEARKAAGLDEALNEQDIDPFKALAASHG
jgi:hypothetical protein